MTDLNNLLQHYRKQELTFINQVLDWISQVALEYRPYLTGFLDPRQQLIVQQLVHQQNDLAVQFFGGYQTAEKKRAYISPDYFEPTMTDFELALIQIDYPTKFLTLSHGKILGTLINNGLDRSVFGDIITDTQQVNWQFWVSQKMQPYLLQNIGHFGKVKVKLKPIEAQEMLKPLDAWQEEQLLVSSLRLDNLLAGVFNISRQRAKQLIQNSQVKLNWQVFQKADFIVALEDMISARGFGRIQLKSIDGQTKKEKFRLTLKVLRK